MSAQPYLAARPREGRQCLLCNEVFTPKERPQTIKLSGLITVKGKAELWAAINVPEEDTPYHEFTFVKERLGNISTECEGHEMCRMKFRTHVERKQKEYGGQEDAGDPMDEDMMQPELPTKTDVHQGKRLMRKVQQKAICFICNTQTPKDCNPYSDGGLGRCSDKRAVTKLEEKIKLTSPGDKYEDAVERFKFLLCGQAFDVFAVDVYYHKTCYTNFTRPTKSANKDVAKDEETQDELITRLKVIGNKVKTEFLALIERKVIKEKEAYLATDLLDEFGSLCTENGLEKGQSSITYTYELKRELQKRFGNAISFYLTGRKLIVHPTSVNPCLYATATLKGAGLRDDDVTRAFANMLRRRLVTETKQAWPITAEELIAKLNKCGPVDVLYNAIAWSINPNATKNESGYVVTSSKSLARKVWSVSSDWEALLTHERSTKSTALSLTVHRLTGSKEATTMQSEDFVETRIRMYEQQKTKSSLPLLPDRSSAVEHVKRSHLQTNIWKQCMNKDIDYPNPENYGWKVEDNSLVPVWFQCSQLPPSLIRRKRQRKKKSDNADSSNFADNESDTPRPSEPPRKRQRQQCAKPSTVCDSSAVEESSDSESSWSSDIMLNDSFTDTGSDSSDDSV